MFENNLKECREDLDMTQTELGKVFDVTKYTVSGWENGHDTMPFSKLMKFCSMYDYSLDLVVGFRRRNVKYGSFKTTKEEIAKKLKELRRELNLSQQALADQCSISRATYSCYETGAYLINTITIYTICKKYNISMDYMCGRCDIKYLD